MYIQGGRGGWTGAHSIKVLDNLINFIGKSTCLQLVFYGISTFVGYLMPNPFYEKKVLFQTIQFIISTQFIMKTLLFQAIQLSQTLLLQTTEFSINIVFVYTRLNVKTVLQTIQFSVSSFNVKNVLFQAIQFSLSTQFSSIWPIDRSLSGATTPE